VAEPLILFWTDAWIDLGRAQRNAAGRYRLTTDRHELAAADAVVFPIPTLGPGPAERAHPDQVWVMWSMECEVHYPNVTSRHFRRQYDLSATYRLDSDVPLPYVRAHRFDALPPLVPIEQRHDVPVSAWISSGWDKWGRDEYLLTLMQHVPVHSYGRVGRNAQLEHDEGAKSKVAAIANYRFTIAFENSIATDYVTEKFFQPLTAGSVPIYRGAPNVRDFAPAEHCYIDADDFAGPQELAEFIRSMSDTDYAAYHAWRDEGASEAFRTRYAPYDEHTFARLARAVTAVQIGRRAAARHTS